jgi:hypothetical protein
MGLSGTVSPDTAAKVGQLTGAKVLVTGRVFKTDKTLFIVTKVIGTETSRVFGQVTQGPASGASIGDMAKEAAQQVAAAIAAHGGQLIAKVETREDRVEKIKQALAGKTLPAVSVQITEQHYGSPVVDPAAETEIGMILKETGFTVVDEKSTQKADIEITGTAFSAFAMFKGNLISCKARVELKVHKAGTGEVLAVDRQTSVAVDIAEQTAAKNALQQAAGELAERILPKLGQ